ncbi:hypothetical protein EPO05_06415 [Patescibacteria group bacterium]|nr:MAG: hypothetical protein EPO05_06415 [Patescibacteria group bacterium]
MPSATSLLKSAASTRKKILAQQDAEVAFDWSNSAQTYDDYVAYSKYLNDRQSKVSDPSQALTYAKTAVAARRSYTSNELQRQQMAIMEGRSTTSDKMNSVYSLYQQAVENQDFNLAQNLASQYDSLSIKLQNEADAAQKVAGAMAMNGVKTLDQLAKKMTKGTELIELPDGTVIKPLAMLNEEMKTNGQTSADYFGEALRTVQALQGVISDAYNGATTQDVVDSIESKYGDYISGEKKFKLLGTDLTLQDIDLAYRSSLANNPLYSPQEIRNEATGALEYKLAKNKIDNFIWTRNDDGTYQATQERTKVPSPYQKLDAKITNEGYFLGESGKSGVSNIGTGEQVKTASAASINDRLKKQGIVASQNGDGSLSLVLPSGEQVQGTIQPDGSIRYFGKPGDYSGNQAGMYEINLFNGNTREVAPDEISMFGDQSQFGGLLSKASDQGIRITQNLTGVNKSPEGLLRNAKITNIKNDFSGMSVPVLARNLQGTPSSILQNAGQVKELQAQKQVQLQQQAAQLQASQTFNLNQTPIQQFASNGAPIRQLTVARPTAQPKLSVAAPVAQPKLNVAAPVAQPKLTVAKPTAQPKLVVR